MRAPNIYPLKRLIESAEENQTEVSGKWVPSRPIHYMVIPYYFKAIWLVITGKADVVVWPEDDDMFKGYWK